MTIFQNLG